MSPPTNLTPPYSKSSVGFSPTTEANCELSDKNTDDKDIQNPSFYDNSERYDFYEREMRTDNECLDGECQGPR